MLVGVPFVASRVGGIPTLLADGEQGLLVAAGDAPALAAAVGRLLADRALAARLGAAARAVALTRHDPARISARTMEIYEDVAGRRRPGERLGRCSVNRPAATPVSRGAYADRRKERKRARRSPD